MKILIVEDQRLIQESFRLMLERYEEVHVVGTASNGQEALKECQRLTPDIILMDISMPVLDGIHAAKIIKTMCPQIKIIMLTASYDVDDITEAVLNGADGYISKNVGAKELLLSINSVMNGFEIMQKDIFNEYAHLSSQDTKIQNLKVGDTMVTLSERELKILKMLVEGLDNHEIGSALFLSEGTVKNTITDMISKLQLRNKTQLAVFALKHRLV